MHNQSGVKNKNMNSKTKANINAPAIDPNGLNRADTIGKVNTKKKKNMILLVVLLSFFIILQSLC